MARLSGSPACFQVPPPSKERQTPPPHPELFRSLASPVPTQITLGSVGATATAPMEWNGCPSKMGENVPPSSDVFITPPVARPT
jgi:hypothetical protein